MRRLYVHVGMPKTATTSIQLSLAAARSTLKRGGLLYPGDEDDHARLAARFHQAKGRHFRFANRGESIDFAEANAAEFLEGIAEEQAGHGGDMLLSSEYLFEIFPDRIRELDSFALSLGLELCAVCYVRHPVASATSSINQQVKMGATTLASGLARLDWHRSDVTLRRYLAVLGRERLRVRSFDDAVANGPVRDLLATIGRPELARQVKEVRGNDSLSYAGVLLADRITRRQEKQPRISDLRSALPHLGGPEFRLPREAAAQVAERGKEEVDWLKRGFGLDLRSPGHTTPLPGAPGDDLLDAILDNRRLLADPAACLARLFPRGG